MWISDLKSVILRGLEACQVSDACEATTTHTKALMVAALRN